MDASRERNREELYRTRLLILVVTGVLFAGAVVGGLVFLLAGSTGASFRIETHEWRRETPVETLMPVDESQWCDRMPADAAKVSRHREVRETRSIRDGETCSNTRVQKDGDTTTRRECTPRFREEPIYDDRCSYTVNRWRATRTEVARGPRSEEPRWPPVKLEKTGLGLGSEREGKGRERWVVVVRDEKDAAVECDLERAHWAILPTTGKLDGRAAALGGKLDCATLKAR